MEAMQENGELRAEVEALKCQIKELLKQQAWRKKEKSICKRRVCFGRKIGYL
jgi:cell division protein FtsB